MTITSINAVAAYTPDSRSTVHRSEAKTAPDFRQIASELRNEFEKLKKQVSLKDLAKPLDTDLGLKEELQKLQELMARFKEHELPRLGASPKALKEIQQTQQQQASDKASGSQFMAVA